LNIYTDEDLKPPLAVPSSMATLPINELKRTHRVRIYTLEDLKWDGKSRPKKSSRDNVTDKSIKRQSSIGGLFHFKCSSV
jgi:hypothetical protein